MKKIAFFNRKGGTGKTTSVVNLSATFEKHRRKKILIVDCDSQTTATEYLLTYTPDRKGYSLKDVIEDNIPVKDVIERVYKNTPGGLDERDLYVIPSALDIDVMELDDYKAVSKVLEPLESEYDYCFFDLPPHLNGVALSALIASDFVIVPAMADTDSLAGFNYLMDHISQIREQGLNTHLEILGILFNNVIHQRAVQKMILASARENMEDLVFNHSIKAGSIVEQARFTGTPLPYYTGSNPIVTQYEDLSKEIEKKIMMKEMRKNG
ncbi:MAG: ParA family protein [Lachnospiraceae bacterium]|nr:ParA family protein [Lachnospiraceae bacterium]